MNTKENAITYLQCLGSRNLAEIQFEGGKIKKYRLLQDTFQVSESLKTS